MYIGIPLIKKFSFLVIIIVLTSIPVKSQFFFRIGIGAGLGLTDYDSTFTNSHFTTQSTTYKKISNSAYGNGISGDISIGYTFKKYFSVELDIRQFYSFSINRSFEERYDYGWSRYEETRNGCISQIVPTIIIFPDFKIFNPYSRIGLIIGFYPLIFSNINYNISVANPTYQSSDIIEGTYYGNIPIGYSAAVGSEFKLNHCITIYVELNLNELHYSPRKYHITKLTQNGGDVDLSTILTRDKEIIFVKAIDSSETLSEDEPTKALKVSFTFTNIQVNFGIKISLGGK